MKKLKALLLTFVSACMFAGCGQQTTVTTGTTATAASSPVIAVDADLSTMDHSVATDGTSFIALTLAMAGLTEIDADMVAKPDLAESWDISEDGLTYTFHLRDASWSNGTPITANDFVFAWRRLCDPNTASEYNYLVDTIHVVNAAEVMNGNLPVEELGVKAIDEKTFEVKLSIPCDFMLSLMAFPSFFALNQEYYESQGDKYATSPENLIYSGPYVMESWTPGNGYTFVKNENYYNASAIANNKIEFRFIQDTQSAMLEYQSGNLDVVKLTGEMVDAYKNETGFTQNLSGYLWYLSINFKNEKLQNLNLRQAFAYAIDRDTIVKNVLKDGAVEANGIIPQKFATSPTGEDYREQNEDLTSYDPAKALEYYEAAKAELGGDVTIELLFEDSEASKAVAEYIQNNLETNLPGITVNLNSKPKKTRLQLMTDGEYEIALHRWGPDYADPQTYIDLFISTSAMNHGKYSSAPYDELVAKAVTGEYAADSQKRWDAMVEAEKILISDDAGVIPVYQNGGAMMINPKVSGIEFHTAGVDNSRHIIKDE